MKKFVGIIFISCISLIAYAESNIKIIDFVSRAVPHFVKHSIAHSCHDFIYDPAWRSGELFIFVLDERGICYVFGDEQSHIGKDFSSYKDVMNMPLVTMFKRACNTKTSVLFPFNNDFFCCYVQETTKDGKKFILGSGYYPHKARQHALNLVQHVRELIALKGAEEAFTIASDPFGLLVRGDVVVKVLDAEGRIVADGTRTLLGQDIFYVTTLPEEVRSKIRVFMRSTKNAEWIDFERAGLQEKIYLERYFDQKTQRTYFLMSNYTDGLTQDVMKQLVKKAAAYMTLKGTQEAFNVFNKPESLFTVGRVKIFSP